MRHITQNMVNKLSVVFELRKLFNLLITAPSDSVRPEKRLAVLALSKDEALVEKMEENDTKTTDLGSIEGAPVMGPMPNPEANRDAADSVMGDDEMDRKSDSSTKAQADPEETDSTLVDTVDGGNVTASNNLPPPSRPPPVPPRPQTTTQPTVDFKAVESVAQQQDAAEILNNIFDLLSCALEGDDTMEDGEQIDLIKKLFFSQVTTVRKTKDTTAQNSALQDHTLISPGDRDRPLYAALDDEFGLDYLSEDESSITAKKIAKYEFMDRAAPILVINVRRLVFEEGKSKKNEHHVGLNDPLYFDRYLARTRSLSERELLERREQQWELKRKLKALEARKAELNETEHKISLAEAVEGAANYIDDLIKASQDDFAEKDDEPIPTFPDLTENMRANAEDLRKEAETLDARMKAIDEEINTIFADCKDHPYRLHAVFIHRGGAAGGHYWIYIRDSKNDIWRKYNDETVEEVEDLKDIFEQAKTSPATSTGIVYVREDKLNELTEAVERNPAKPPPMDVEMKDADSLPNLEGVPLNDVQVLDGVEKE